MVVKAVVFGGDERVHHVRGNLVKRHPLSVGPTVFGQQLAIGRHELRGLLGLGLADIANARGEGNQRHRIQQQCQRQGGEQPHQAVQRHQPFGPAHQAGQRGAQRNPAH